jgi:hypothetical protein
MKKMSTKASVKPSRAFYAVHKELLRVKTDTRSTYPSKPIEIAQFPGNFDPELALQQLVGAIEQCFLHADSLQLDTPVEHIVRAGTCLFQGTSQPEESLFKGLSPAREAWRVSPLEVPRTDDEAEARADAILDAKHRRKKQRETTKKEPENQGPSRSDHKRPRLESPPEEESQSSLKPDMELDHITSESQSESEEEQAS